MMNRCTLNERRVEGYGRLLSTAGEELRDEVCGVGFFEEGWFLMLESYRPRSHLAEI